jgi:hypothetical protein
MPITFFTRAERSSVCSFFGSQWRAREHIDGIDSSEFVESGMKSPCRQELAREGEAEEYVHIIRSSASITRFDRSVACPSGVVDRRAPRPGDTEASSRWC